MSRYRGPAPEADYVQVARVEEVPPGRMKRVEVDGRDGALINLDGAFFAIDNNCPHNGGPLGRRGCHGKSESRMNIDTGSMVDRDGYKLLIGSVIPRPVAWVSTSAADGCLNLAPFSFFQAVCSEPPTVVVSVGRRADGEW